MIKRIRYDIGVRLPISQEMLDLGYRLTQRSIYTIVDEEILSQLENERGK